VKSKTVNEQIRQVLMESWDPIGVAHEVDAQDEYDYYILPLHFFLIRGADAEEIVTYLWRIETQEVGLGRLGRTRLYEVARRLLSLNMS
jgi:hypothetical protein